LQSHHKLINVMEQKYSVVRFLIFLFICWQTRN